IQERHQPGKYQQPGAIAAPLHGLDLIQNNAVHPGKSSINDCGDRTNGGSKANAELSNIRQEVLEVIGLDIGHKAEAQVANTEESFQSSAEPLSLFLVLRHETISSILSFPPIIDVLDQPT